MENSGQCYQGKLHSIGSEVWMDEYKNYYYERFNYDLEKHGGLKGGQNMGKGKKVSIERSVKGGGEQKR